jgi:hypothetical protein
MFNEIFGRGSLKDYCPISIVKEEADWEYISGVLAQEVYSLYLNNTFELNKNAMLIHCIWIQYIIYSIFCTMYSLLYIVNCALQTVYSIEYTAKQKQWKKIIFSNLNT